MAAHVAHAAHADEHHHPPASVYLRIAAILFILTIFEVGVFYIPGMETAPFFPPILLTLATAKFILVVGYYMHLKFDGRLMTGLFVGPLILALAILLAFMALFSQFSNPHPPINPRTNQPYELSPGGRNYVPPATTAVPAR